MRRTSINATLALAAVALATTAGAAGAQAAGGFQVAKFRATISGTQKVSYASDHDSTGTCDPSDHTTGGETIRFAGKPVILQAVKVPGDDPELVGKNRGLVFPAKATVERSYHPRIGSVPDACGASGGGGGDSLDCGTKVIKRWPLTVQFWKPGKVELLPLKATDDPYENCAGDSFMYPFLLHGRTLGKRQSADLEQDELFDKKLGKLISLGHGDSGIVSTDYEEHVRTDWKLTLYRVK